MTASRRVDVCVVGLGPAGRAFAHRATAAGLSVVALDPHPDRLWRPTYSCWVDELPAWLPGNVIAQRIAAPTVWTPAEHRVDRPYCVLSKPHLQAALSLDDTTVFSETAVSLTDAVHLSDGTVICARVVVDARGLPRPGNRPAASAHGIFLDAEAAAPALPDDHGLLVDWRPDNGAAPTEPPSFLYAMPLGDGRVIFEETSLGIPGGISQRVLRKRALNRLAARGVTLRGNESAEAAHYPLDQQPPPLVSWQLFSQLKAGNGARRPGTSTVLPFGSRGGMLHPCTGYSVATALNLVDPAVTAISRGQNPIEALWPLSARLTHGLRRRGLAALGRLTTAQTAALLETFFTSPYSAQKALLSDHTNWQALGSVMIHTVARTHPFHWRFDQVGWTHRHRWTHGNHPGRAS